VAGEDPDRLEVLRRYLENKGIDLNERETMVDSLLDWVEPNTGLHHLNAPPESDDYHPPHAGGLTQVDELKKVAGWADFTATPGWDDDFTVNTRTGVEMRWASGDVLLALPGLTPEIVERFLQLRQGPDGIDGTADDMVFKGNGNDEILLTMGFRKDQIDKLKNSKVLAQAPVQVFRVVSIGRAGKAIRTVQIVFAKAQQPNVIAWKEF